MQITLFKKNKVRLVISILLFFFHTKSVEAKVIINELYPAPETGEKEWVELLCLDDIEDLTSWSLWDELSSPSLIFSFTDQVMNPDELLIVELSSKLNNSADGVVLKNNLEEIIDQFSYQSSLAGQSWSKNQDSTWILTSPSKGLLNPAVTPTPTPTPTPQPTITPTPTPVSLVSSSSVRLSEIMACPSTGSEWVELENLSDEPVDLGDWSLYDNKSSIYLFTDEVIPANSWLSVDINSRLNNSGDKVVLKNDQEEVIAEMSYQDCQKDFSYIFYENSWQTTSILSKNSGNTLSSLLTDNPSDLLSTEKINNLIKNDDEKQTINSINHQTSDRITLTVATNSAMLDIPGEFVFLAHPAIKKQVLSVIIGGFILISLGTYNLIYVVKI